jgi:nucleoside-diphosphate-sugar epimerase
VATQLSDAGHEVLVVTRRGQGTSTTSVSHLALDATQAVDLTRAAEGSAALFNCANPPYHQWATQWPPLAASLLTAAEATGATLVSMSNLYAYGPPKGPMTPEHPLSATYEKARVRAEMWRTALALHEAGRIRAAEVRASDFIGCRENTMFGDRVVPRLLAGKAVTMIGDPDALHSWTHAEDAAQTLVSVAVTPAAWGRVWHAPTNAPRSSRGVVEDLCTAAGVDAVTVRSAPRSALYLAGVVSPMLRELRSTLYQFEQPFVIDDQATRATLGLEPTPWPEVLKATLGACGVPVPATAR